MRGIKTPLNTLLIKTREKHPDYTSYTLLAEAIKDRNYTAREIRKAFNKTMSREDYRKSEKEGLINYLLNITKNKNNGKHN